MITSFSGESRLRAEIQVSVITFGGSQAELNLPLTLLINSKALRRWLQKA